MSGSGWDEADAIDDDVPEERPPRGVSDLAYASSLLRGAAVLAVVMWVIGVVAATWFQWAQLDTINQFGGGRDQPRLMAALAAGFTQTWGYLLVAVVAFAAAVLVAPSASAEPESLTDGTTPDRS